MQKDGYFILKANDKRISYDKCFCTLSDTVGGAIFAGDSRIESDTIHANDYSIFIFYIGNAVGTYNSYDSAQPSNLDIMIKFENKTYRFPTIDPYTLEQKSEVNLEIKEYDSKNGKCKGSISGKFFIENGGTDFIEIKDSKFLAMDYHKY